jgi:hypothetical protein
MAVRVRCNSRVRVCADDTFYARYEFAQRCVIVDRGDGEI